MLNHTETITQKQILSHNTHADILMTHTHSHTHSDTHTFRHSDRDNETREMVLFSYRQQIFHMCATDCISYQRFLLIYNGFKDR